MLGFSGSSHSEADISRLDEAVSADATNEGTITGGIDGLDDLVRVPAEALGGHFARNHPHAHKDSCCLLILTILDCLSSHS